MNFTINIYNYYLINQNNNNNNTVNFYPTHQQTEENVFRSTESDQTSTKYKIYDTKELFAELKKTEDAFNEYYERLCASITNPTPIANSNKPSTVCCPIGYQSRYPAH